MYDILIHGEIRVIYDISTTHVSVIYIEGAT